VTKEFSFADESVPEQRGKEGNGQVAFLEAIAIIERLEIIEVAVTEETRPGTIANSILNIVTNGSVARKTGQRILIPSSLKLLLIDDFKK
jgi:hypothetical protein